MENNMNELGEDENELELINTSKTRKKGNILDSDSEKEVLNSQIRSSSMDDEVLQPENTRKKGTILDSDSENEVEMLNNQITSSIMDDDVPQPITKKKLKRILESDTDSEEESGTSENLPVSSNFKDTKDTDKSSSCINDMEEIVEEEEVTPHNKSFPDERSAIQAVYMTNSKGELVPESGPLKKSLLALCDAESDEDTGKSEEMLIPRVYKRSQKKKDGPKRMSAQEAAKQRTEIHSESQRMLRESNVSLPYHKPKSYTIKEFLEKRSKLTSAVSSASKAPPSIAIKMSKDQLKEVSKKLNERMKEVEEFYKSESEDEEKEDDPSEEIRGWLNFLADNAVDTVENKIAENEASNQQANEEKEEEVPNQQESMEYEFDLDDVDENDGPRKPSIMELVKDKLNIQPKLSGTPNDIIDLEEGTTKLSGVRRLVEKFFRHTTKKVNPKNQVELDVIEVCSGGQIVKETVSMNVDEEEPNLEETPGAKLQKLREDLQLQMAQKRLELWKQKQKQGDILICEKKTENITSEGEKDILDDEEEEFEMTESETDDDEEEYELEKPRAKSVFVDQEAAEDDEEIDEEKEDDEESKQGYEGDVDDDVCDDSDVEQTPPKEELEDKPKKKVLKRIVKPFAEDSDEEDQEVSYEADEETGSTNVLKYYTTDENDFLPPNLPRVDETPQLTQPPAEKKKSEFEFLTPVTYLTGLQNLNSGSKFSKESPVPVVAPLNTSPEERDSQSSVQKELFPKDSDVSPTSQAGTEDLAHLCSGIFSETLNLTNQDKASEEISITTQDLVNVCSGDFSTLTTNKEYTTKDISAEEVAAGSNIRPSADNEIKNLDEEHEQIISQLLDEDEFERFKKKFESPVVRKNILQNVKEVNATGLINSDEENEELEIKTKKRKMKLVFSDDEDEEGEESDDDNLEPEENIDLNNDDEEQQMENEIVAQESYNYKYTDFLDKEAELSESEWGSADEDEKGLDDLEFEQGDEETFNENKMRSEIERVHMRQLLDEDNREVKLLQELLLEDGELHGTGRKRQFRWKTFDSTDNGEFKKGDDDDIYLDEEESEEQWRKMRHKREMFLKKKTGAEDDDSIIGDSQILKVGQQILKNRSFNSQSNTPVNKAEDGVKHPFSLLNKRGSFLSRSDQVLQRLAEYNKVTATTGANTARNSKSFVFQSVDAGAIVKVNNNKRKATEGTPNVIKKLRLDDLSPAVTKQGGKSSRAKKLFGNW